MGESTAFMRCQANSGQEISHNWDNTCGDRNDGGLSGEFSCSPGLSQISPIIGNIKSKETSPCSCPSSAAGYLFAPEKSQHHSGLLVRLCLLGLDLWPQATLLTRGWGELLEAGHYEAALWGCRRWKYLGLPSLSLGSSTVPETSAALFPSKRQWYNGIIALD